MRFYRLPLIARVIYPSAVCLTNGVKREVYITFDDGPNPSVTSDILDILGKSGVKATFFLRGDKAEKYPGLCREISDRGHQTGNHTYDHPDGWLTSAKRYIENVDRAAEVIKSRLFRPPYGRLTPAQYLALKKRYTIVLWDVMAYDFDQSEKEEILIGKIQKRIRPGSVVVLHDSDKSMVVRVLEPLLENIISNGLTPIPLPSFR